MEDLDIFDHVNGPTPLLTAVVIPKLNADIRLYLDVRHANEVIARGHDLIPTVDDLLHNINASMIFSKLHLKWGYHELKLTMESSGIHE